MLSKQLKSNSFSRQVILLLIFTILVILASQQSVQAIEEIGYHKVIAPKNKLTNDGHRIILWQDYGSFGLYRIRNDVWQKLPRQLRSEITSADDMDFLLLDNRNINTQTGDSNTQELQNLYDGKALHLIQFVGPLKDEWLTNVQAAGTDLVHYVANNGYLVWTDENGRQKLQTLAEQSDFLQYSSPYLPSYKKSPTLNQQDSTQPDENELITVIVQIYRHADAEKSKAMITNLFVDTVSKWEPILNYENITGVIHRKDISAVTHLPDVVWVGERLPRELMDEVQGQILAGSLNPDFTAPSGPGYFSWFASLGLSTDPNDYPIVDITDDGIGNGQVDDAGGDITLRELGDSNKPSRIAYIANCTSAPSGAGPVGHGHLNVSIAGSYDDRAGGPYRDEAGYQRGLGINPYGRFAGTRVFGDEFNLNGCGGTEQSLIRQTYNLGARITSNSWGCHGCAGTYDESSQAYDAGVRDADYTSPGNQELLVLFSAGNVGPDPNTVGTPGNGKNVVTIGASENVRANFPNCQGIGLADVDNVQDIARFSSRGPAPGGRVKPDLVAPGTVIQGTASTDPDYIGGSQCPKYFPDGQQIFTASSGTSHSTPAIAGMASLAHTFIRLQEGMAAPSPALLKGFLIANTSYLTGEGAGGDLPSQSQGFGLPDMTAAFNDTPLVLIDQGEATLFTESGATWSKTVSVANPAEPVRIVLAYTDQPGVIGTQPQVNDLNLSVYAQNETYLGNHMTGQWSVTGGTADKVNNVEAVFLPSGTNTNLQIVVTAFNIAGDGVPGVGDETDQDFTLVCSNCIEQDFTLTANPQTNGICLPGSVHYTVIVGSANFSDPVTLHLANVPPGVTPQFESNPVDPPGQSLLTLTAEQIAAPGSYPITVIGTSTNRQHTLQLNLDIFSDSPTAPQLLSPLNNATDQPTDISLTWSQVNQAATYDIEIATDSGFQQITASVADLIVTSFTPSNLKSSQLYYWRVRSVNGCGKSEYSEANMFTTEVLPGACPVGVVPNVLYQTDFEEMAPGWSSGGMGDTWTLSKVKSNSSETSYYALNVAVTSDQILVSPAITLPVYEGPLSLQFWNYQEIESDKQSDDKCFDGALLEISTDDGLSWQQLGGLPDTHNVLVTDPYDGYVTNDNPLGISAVWCGDPQDWLNSVVRLDDFAEKTVRFRFRLATDNSKDREGWYIDDVLVQSCPVIVAKVYIPFVISP